MLPPPSMFPTAIPSSYTALSGDRGLTTRWNPTLHVVDAFIRHLSVVGQTASFGSADNQCLETLSSLGLENSTFLFSSSLMLPPLPVITPDTESLSHTQNRVHMLSVTQSHSQTEVLTDPEDTERHKITRSWTQRHKPILDPQAHCQA